MQEVNQDFKAAHTNIVIDVSQIIAPMAYLLTKLILSSVSKISKLIAYVVFPRKNLN
jgi:hypothetical protein